jgi:Tfp pilus assembly protein PilF
VLFSKRFDLRLFGQTVLALVDQNKLEDAAKEYRIAIDLNKTFADPHRGLAQVLQRQNRPEDAAQEYRIANKLEEAPKQ